MGDDLWLRPRDSPLVSALIFPCPHDECYAWLAPEKGFGLHLIPKTVMAKKSKKSVKPAVKVGAKKPVKPTPIKAKTSAPAPSKGKTSKPALAKKPVKPTKAVKPVKKPVTVAKKETKSAKPAAKQPKKPVPAPKSVQAKSKASPQVKKPAPKPAKKTAAPAKTVKPAPKPAAKVAVKATTKPAAKAAPKAPAKPVVEAKKVAAKATPAKPTPAPKKPAAPVIEVVEEVKPVAKPAEPAKATKAAKTPARAISVLPPPEARAVTIKQPIDEVTIEPSKGPVKFTPFLKKQKQRLIDLRSSLLDMMDGFAQDTIRNRPEGGDASGGGMHMGDAGSDAYDRDFALTLLGKEQDALYEINEALKRIELGTYGICEMSAKKINEERLEALPFARFTREMQEQIERDQIGGKNRRVPLRSVFGLEGEEDEDEDGDDEGSAPAPAQTSESSLDFMKE